MITNIHLAFSTNRLRHSGTKNGIVLILGDHERDLLHHTFELEDRIEEGSAHFLTLDVRHLKLPNYFRYARVGIRGADAWWPETIFAFGETDQKVYTQANLIPIGLDLWVGDRLSTDEEEGKLSVPMHRANYSGMHNEMNRVMVLALNGSKGYDGTKSQIRLEITTKDGQLTDFQLRPEQIALPGATCLMVRYVGQEYSPSDIRSIRLYTDGSDAWLPERFLLFGIDRNAGSYRQIYPFVNIQNWESTGLGKLTTNADAGSASVTLYQAFL